MARAPPAQSPPRAPPRAALGPHASAPAGLDFLQLLLEREQERGRRGAAPGPAPAGSLEPEPRVPASPPGYYVRHPAARTPGGGAGHRSAAPGRRLAARALVPAWRRGCARPRGSGRALLAPWSLGARAQSFPPPPLALASRLSHRPLVPSVSGLVPGTAIQTPAAREDRSPSGLPRIPLWEFPRASPSAPACKGTQPCPTGPRGDLSWHLPAGQAPRGPVPSGGTGVRWVGEHARPQQRGAWEEAGLCRLPGSPYPGLSTPTRLSNLWGGVKVWTTGFEYFLKNLKIVFGVWRTLEPLSPHLSPGFSSEWNSKDNY